MPSHPRNKLIASVSNSGQECIEVMVHRAYNLSSVRAQPPLTYVAGQSRYTLSTQYIGSKPNATSSVEGLNPAYNDIIFVETLEQHVPKEELVLLIIDEYRHRNIGEFRIPWMWLQPYYHYHLELNLGIHIKKGDAHEMKLYVSLIRKQSSFYLENNTYGIEALLNQFDNSLSSSQNVYAVARVVNDFRDYRDNYLGTSRSGITFKQVFFPSPEPSAFQQKSFGGDGYPQLSLACPESKTPTWRHTFCFTSKHEKDCMFIEKDVSLVIEFYRLNPKIDVPWKISNLIGWCRIRLDNRCRKCLEQDPSLGYRTEKMLIEDFIEKGPSSAEVVLRLNEKIPRGNLDTLDASRIAILPSFYVDKNTKTSSEAYLYKQVYPTPNGDFRLNYLDKEKTKYPLALVGGPRTPFTDDFLEVPVHYRPLFLNFKKPNPNDLVAMLVYYRQLLSAFKNLARRMDSDASLYKNQIRNLEIANAQLSARLDNSNEKRSELVKQAELDKMDRAKLQKAYLELQTQLLSRNYEIVVLKDQIKNLEAEVERLQGLDEQIKRLMAIQKAMNNEMENMQERMDNVYALEETCRRQEIVIEKMEGMVRKLWSDRKGTSKEYEFKKYKQYVHGELNDYNDFEKDWRDMEIFDEFEEFKV